MSPMGIYAAAGPEALAPQVDNTSSSSRTVSSIMDIDIPTNLDSIKSSVPSPTSRSSSFSDEMNYHWGRDTGSNFPCLRPETLQAGQGYQPLQSPWKLPAAQIQTSHWPGLSNNETVSISSVIPGPVFPTEAQMKVARLYGLRRKDGTYVPLVPLDELHSIELSKLQARNGPENMIVLPELQLPMIPHGGEDQMVAVSLVQSLPFRKFQSPSGTVRAKNDLDDVQNHINSIVATNPAAHRPVHSRREKIYCAKWIHEGTCAFTQLGCKYKHEMPMDKKTQVSLGLNTGIPKWYKQKHQIQFQPNSRSSPTSTFISDSPSPSSPYSQSSWRVDPITPSRQTRGQNSVPRLYGPSNFGPIGPPSSTHNNRKSQIPCSNPFDTLRKDDSSEEEGDIVVKQRS